MGWMGPETLLADPGEAQEGVGQKGQGLGVRRRGQTGNKPGPLGAGGHVARVVTPRPTRLPRFNDEVKHIKVVEKDSWIHITEAKKFESLLVGDPVAPSGGRPGLQGRGRARVPHCLHGLCRRHFPATREDPGKWVWRAPWDS